jgi:hypothetical protein
VRPSWPISSAALAIALAACKQPSQATIEIRTDVRAASPPARASIAVGDGVAAEVERWKDDGAIGSLTVVPRDGSEGSFALEVLIARGRTLESCRGAEGAPGCIRARRRLAFLPHAALRVPLVVWDKCDGVACAPDRTCDKNGKCVQDAMDPLVCANPDGCVLAGDPGPNDPFPGVVPLPVPPLDAGAD